MSDQLVKENQMPRRPWRKVFWTLAVLLLAAACYCVVQCVLQSQEVALARNAKFMTLDVDLSRPGKYEGLFNKTHHGHIGTALTLKVGPTTAGATAATQPTANLDANASMAFFDSSGTCVFETELPADGIQKMLPDDMVLLPKDAVQGYQRFYDFSPRISLGKYKFVLDVRRPVPALAGRKQTLTAHNMLCGCESFFAVVFFLGACVFGLPGGIIALCLICTRRKRAARSSSAS